MATHILRASGRGNRPARRSSASVPAAAGVARTKGLAPCLAYLIVEYARPMDWLPLVGMIKPGMIVSLWGFFATLQRKARPIPRPIWYMFGMIAVMAWNVPWAVNNRWAFWGFQDFTLLVLGCVLPLAVLPASTAAVRILLTAYVFCHVPMALHGLMHEGTGFSGWVGDENDLALALNAATGVAIYLFNESSSWTKKLLLIAAIGIMLAGVVATESRGGFIGLASLGAFVLLVGPHRGRILTVVIIAGIALAILAPPGYWDEMRSIRTAGDPGDTGEQRMYFWGLAWRMYLDHPIVGVGSRNYGIRAPEYESFERAHFQGQHVWGRVAHSLYFTLIAEQGSIGTLMFLAVVGWCAKVWRRLRREARATREDRAARSRWLLASGIFAGMFAVLTTGAFLSVLYYPILWGLAGLMGSLEGTTPAAPVVKA